jgi:hypothetical protein
VQQQTNGSDGGQKRPAKTVARSVVKSPLDTVTLSTGQADSGAAPKLKPSQPVTTAEKSALHAQFSVYA